MQRGEIGKLEIRNLRFDDASEFQFPVSCSWTEGVNVEAGRSPGRILLRALVVCLCIPSCKSSHPMPLAVGYWLLVDSAKSQ